MGGERGTSPVDAFAWGSIVLGGSLDVGSEFERRLSIGAYIACRLRGAVRDQLGESLRSSFFICHVSLGIKQSGPRKGHRL